MSEPLVPAQSPTCPAPAARPAKELLWRQRLDRFSQSGLSAREFCAREGIALPTFSGWKRRLTTAADPAAAPGAEPPPFVPGRLLADAPAPLQLALPSGAVLHIGPSCDPDLLARVLALLGVTPC
jgi:hypothetical protein